MKKFLLFIFVIFLSQSSYAKNISLTVFPENAVVIQNGKVLPAVSNGTYSIEIILAPKTLVIQADGYESQTATLNLNSPRAMKVELSLNRKDVSITSIPSNASIFVDGIEMGEGIANFTIKKGESKQIRITEKGFDTYVGSINFYDQYDKKMSYNIDLKRNEREANILVDAPAAEFYADGKLIGKGKNSASITLYKGQDVELVVRAEGYLEFSRILKFEESISSYNLTQDMAIDESYVASEPGTDLANTRTEFTVKKGLTRDEAIRRIKYYVGELFQTYEVNDNFSGWYRTVWNVETFPGNIYVRSRVEIKEIPDNGDGQVKFKFLLESQITNIKDATDEHYRPWKRVLKKYAKLAQDVRYKVE